MKERVILHADINNFYASVECLHRPELRNRPVAVGGDESLRHGIVLAKNYAAKATGIRTGETLWQARLKCPGLVVLPPNYPLYLRFARFARQIYADFTDRIEPFGLDEAWLDVSGRDGVPTADTIRERLRRELGVTASVGVSYNKIFAKLGSDIKKPDATTLVSRENFRIVAWPLPVEELLYVGRATREKLRRYSIHTIGQLAAVPLSFLRGLFGKVGDVLHTFANGRDQSPVMRLDEEELIRSIGNSTTTPRDLTCDDEVKIILFVLCESVCARMREYGLLCRTVAVSIRDNTLFCFERQTKLPAPSHISAEIAGAALQLFRRHYNWPKPIRSVGVRCSDLLPANGPLQLTVFDNDTRDKLATLDKTVDDLRKRFGHFCIQRASVSADRPLGGINPKGDHVIYPVGFFRDGMLK
ncbi:MAG: DNA polymerase IV [Firmicutes bacterium]|nr:DNA polymerase IV [Bacillota bacterium]